MLSTTTLAKSGTSWLAPGLSPRTFQIALIVSGAFFIEQLDSTIIATVVPEIAHALGTEPVQLNAAMTAYMLGLAIFVPISGRIADRFGARDVFGAATAVFLIGSLLCGAANSVGMLIAARFLQGVGGAMMAPVGRLIVLRTAAKSELVEAMAWVLLPAMIAPMIGPLAGGLIASLGSWRWIFLVNIPLGVAAIFLIIRHVDNERQTAAVSFDWLGTALTGASFATATLGVELLSHPGASLWTASALLLLAALCFCAYLAHSRRHRSPVLDLTLIQVSSFRWSLLGGSLFRIGVGGVPFLLPLALQLAYGLSPLESGMVVLLPAVGGFAMKFMTTRLLRQFGYRDVLIINGLAAATLLATVALARPGWPWWLTCGILVLFGLSRSLHMNAYGTLAYAEVPKERMASATSFFLSIQNLTVGFGVAFSATSVRFAQAWLPQSSEAVHFSVAFAALAGCCVASMALSFMFDRSAGAVQLGRAVDR